MPASSWKVEDLIPHRPPMVLLDRIESFDASSQTLVASFVGRDGWRGNWAAIEYMAQAAAALAGAFAQASGDAVEAARPGLLLGTRRLELGLAEFVCGQRYFVRATRDCADGDSATFACEIWAEGAASGADRCTATLVVCRPEHVSWAAKPTPEKEKA